MAMDRLTTLNQALTCIEANLTQPFASGEMARACGYSRFHFDRLFLEVMGETAATYIRRRRLSEAARELVFSSREICDIALDYQFSSQETFSRAFRHMFGLSPLAYRRRGRLARFQPPVRLGLPRLALIEGIGLRHVHAKGTILFAYSPAQVYLAYR
jgi:AraC family transcriptional regulator